MDDVIIFGAGKMGNKCVDILLGWRKIYCFCDNNKELQGKTIKNIEIVSFEQMKSIVQNKNIDIVLSLKNGEIEEQLARAGLEYWTYFESTRCYFERADVCSDMDQYLLDSWIYDQEDVEFLFKEEKDNWYRTNFLSEENLQIVKRAVEGVDENSRIYECDVFYKDEKYEYRPGMRLIRNILLESGLKYDICDVACGHGELLSKLKEDGHSVLGIDLNAKRVEYIRSKGLEAYCGAFEREIIHRKFDVIIVQEFLEHVMDPGLVVKAVKNILLHNGRVFVTVPYGAGCDCDEHVRHFTENSLASLFMRQGFFITNIQRIPYLNNQRRNSILMEARINA